MDLKQSLQMLERLSGKKQVSQWLIYTVGLFGLALVVGAAWLGFADWRMAQVQEDIAAESEAALTQLAEPVQSLKRVLTSEQAQSLAARALDNPDTVDDLLAYLHGRMGQISTASVYPADLSGIAPEDLGPNGYALFEMLLSALDGSEALLQAHHVLKPPAMLDAVRVRSGDEVLGVLVVTIDPDLVLSVFHPEISTLGCLRLSQYNGAQPSSALRDVGDPGLLGDIPERIAVPGTLFRIEFPRQQYVALASGGWLALLMLIGLTFVAAAFLLKRSDEKWALERRIEEAKRSRERLAAEADQPSPDRPLTPPPDNVGPPAMEPAGEPPPLRLKYNIPEKHKLKEAQHSPVELTPEIFRAYDIRGVIDRSLDSGVAWSVGQAVGTLALEQNAGPVVVARDGRLSGPYLMQGMIDGILSTGCDVLDIGAVPTGVLYFAAHEIAAGSGVMITGSHNPPDYNGFKIMIAGDTLYGDGISGLYQRIVEGQLQSGQGRVTRRNVVPDYIEKIAGDIQVERPLKVVIDCGNGIGGVCAADTLRAIGVEVIPLFDEVDGTFPNHHPDPSEPENLKDLIESVRLMDADLGLALDGDADRLGVVTLAGNIIFPDRVMMLLAMDVLDRVPGATIIYDVKCTGHLPQVIREAGGVPMMYKTGHSLIKAKMKEVGSPFAGEMSGHFFFKERWYGVDDGIYSAARLLEILGSTETPPEAILNALPSSYSTPELKVQMQEGENHRFIEDFKTAARFEGAEISTIDGLRADFADGWGLVRASNTTPILVVRFDAETEQALERIKAVFRSAMLGLRPDLELPF
ncbi:MAG: phosphomannomutase/phosphoglucomutase [Xanthomonadales bacterium]|jgi:phosphomannomutase/phosphoglucomutase|nr:phosphomannomutase/phosphoglucomutase [Xanthomonadales bacterium]